MWSIIKLILFFVSYRVIESFKNTMTTSTLSSFIPSRGRILDTLKRCNKFGFYTLFNDINNYAHRVSTSINQHPNIALLQTSLDFCNFIKNPTHLRKRSISKMNCSFYIENIAWEKNLEARIHDLMLTNKTIFIIIDFERYLLSYQNQYDTHSVCIILHPSTKGNYNMFYINSHGKDLFGDKKSNDTLFTFDIIKSSTKTRINYDEVQLPLPGDFVFMNYFHTHLQKYIRELEGPEFIIHYDQTEKHNYLGCNMQSGDNHGICFVFPYLIWYNLITYYTSSQQINNMTFPSIKTLLNQKNLNVLVPLCFAKLSKHFGDILTQKKEIQFDMLKDFIIQKQTRFLKEILCPFIDFMTQPHFIKKFYTG